MVVVVVSIFAMRGHIDARSCNVITRSFCRLVRKAYTPFWKVCLTKANQYDKCPFHSLKGALPMSVKKLSILWAAIIIAVAIYLSESDLNPGTSLGVIGGLSGAAIGTIQARRGRKKGCC